MKVLLLILLLSGCSLQPEIQAEFQCVKFVKMETWERADGVLYAYYWIGEDRMEYLVTSKNLRVFKVGECISALVRK